jgi:hypothetical protein
VPRVRWLENRYLQFFCAEPLRTLAAAIGMASDADGKP